MKNEPGYFTYGRFVYLGRVAREVRYRAKKAGLTIVTSKRMSELLNVPALTRIRLEGVWYDTVKY